MIRINLAHQKKDTGANRDTSDPMEGMLAVSDDEIRKQAVIRIFIIILFPAFLYAWEMYSLPQKKSQVTARQTVLSQLTAKNLQAKAAVEEISKFQVEQNKIQAQINIIEGLKKGRMQEVKVLDSIQRMIPPKVWLNRVEISGGKMTITGHAAADSGLTSFMDAMSRSIFFREVSLIRSTDFQDDKVSATVKKFEISCLVEKVL